MAEAVLAILTAMVCNVDLIILAIAVLVTATNLEIFFICIDDTNAVIVNGLNIFLNNAIVGAVVVVLIDLATLVDNVVGVVDTAIVNNFTNAVVITPIADSVIDIKCVMNLVIAIVAMIDTFLMILTFREVAIDADSDVVINRATNLVVAIDAVLEILLIILIALLVDIVAVVVPDIIFLSCLIVLAVAVSFILINLDNDFNTADVAILVTLKI
jgi:hypothetical protein